MKDAVNILVVDDNEAVCQLLKETFSGEGYSVTAVMRGEESLTELRRQPYHLVLLDLVLPGMHGSRILKEIKRDFSNTDVIIITSHSSLDTAVEALRLGAQDYLIKPFEDLEMVVRAVRKVLEKRQLIEQNELLYQELRTKNQELESAVQRLSSLNEMGQALQSILDPKELLNAFVHLVATRLGAERVSLMILHQRTGSLVIEASMGLDEEIARQTRIKVGEGVAGWVVKEGEAILVEDIDKDPRFQKRAKRGYRSDSFISAPVVLSVPIKLKQEVLGVINVNNKRNGGVFSGEDLEFVSTLASQAALAIENARIFEELQVANQTIKDNHFEVIMALAEALESKDVYTRKHSDRTIRNAVSVGKRLGLSAADQEHLKYAAALHDIGKIGIPEGILNKPAPLTAEEYEVMKRHPKIGAQILATVKSLAPVIPLVLHDHERYDGTGYPDGIAGDKIPLGSRIIAVVDAYDAMTTDRVYRKAPGRSYAIEELKSYAGRQFDPIVVEALLSLLAEEKVSTTKEEN